MICSATINDLDSLLKITSACAFHMEKQNIFQWNSHYPNSNAFEEDIKREELFVYKINGDVIGCISVSTLMDDVYKHVSWLTPSINNIYIHRLAVHPDFQGIGIARKLMDFAEQKSKIEKRTSVRLDTFSKNLRNRKFYEHRGYKRLENIFFLKQSEHPFYCYELIL